MTKPSRVFLARDEVRSAAKTREKVPDEEMVKQLAYGLEGDSVLMDV